jgi:hypothetical protein
MAAQVSVWLLIALALLSLLYITPAITGEMVMEVPSPPYVSSVSPTQGGVAGGTLLYIFGTGFSSDQYMGGNVVFIGDTPCDVISYFSNSQQVRHAQLSLQFTMCC